MGLLKLLLIYSQLFSSYSSPSDSFVSNILAKNCAHKLFCFSISVRLPIQHLPSSYLTVSFLVENPFVHWGTFSMPSPWRSNVLSSAYSAHPDYLPLIHIIKLLCFETFMSKGLRTPAQVPFCLLMLPYMDGMILDMLPFPMY